jgi:simple sugar transport system substrate-binding protein
VRSCGRLCGEWFTPSGRPHRSDAAKIRIVTVVKRTGIGWFERMQDGIKQFAAQNDVDAIMTGASDADPEKQADIIRKLIAEKPNAITVVPNTPEVLASHMRWATAPDGGQSFSG